jgi:uncharacterized membrane protein YdjX (TVP38/TMEM64 family)
MRAARLATVVLVVALLLVAHQLGLLSQFGEPTRLKDTLLELGPWGYLAFIAAYTMLQPFGVPGTAFVVAASLVWPWPLAFALSMVGTCAASVVGFSFARFIARDWVASRVPARFHAWDDALARRAFTTVFLLRLIFWMPQALHTFFGLSRVPFWTHLWASAAGYVLPLLVVSYFGQAWVASVLEVSPSGWGWVGGGVVAVAVSLWAIRRARRVAS